MWCIHQPFGDVHIKGPFESFEVGLLFVTLGFLPVVALPQIADRLQAGRGSFHFRLERAKAAIINIEC